MASDPFRGCCILLYGPPKIGKTSFVASMPKPLIFATEPGHRYIDKKIVIRLNRETGWKKLKDYLALNKLLERKPATVVVDTFGALYRMCFQYVCSKSGIEHPEDAPRGKGWEKIRLEFDSVINQLCEQAEEINATIVWTGHSKLLEVKTRDESYSRIEVDLPGQARAIALPVPDQVWYMGYRSKDGSDILTETTGHRCLWIEASEIIEAGNRDGAKPKLGVIKNLPKEKPYLYVVRAYLKAQQNESQRQTQENQ